MAGAVPRIKRQVLGRSAGVRIRATALAIRGLESVFCWVWPCQVSTRHSGQTVTSMARRRRQPTTGSEKLLASGEIHLTQARRNNYGRYCCLIPSVLLWRPSMAANYALPGSRRRKVCSRSLNRGPPSTHQGAYPTAVEYSRSSSH